MTKAFEFNGVEAEKAEAMRIYNNRRNFRYIVRAVSVALFGYLWFPKVAILLQITGDWFLRSGAAVILSPSVAFVILNLLIAMVYFLSLDNSTENSDTEPDLYDQYTTSSTAIVTVSAAAEKVEDDDDDDDSKKQIVPAFTTEVEKVVVMEANPEAVTTDLEGVYGMIKSEAKKELDREAVTEDVKGVYRRTKSERKKKISRPVVEYRRTESARVGTDMDRLSSEEFRLTVESFILKNKRNLIQENDAVRRSVRPTLVVGYGSC